MSGINGPNLNLLGIREKSIYGETSFEEYLSGLRDFYTMVEIDYYQSNVEGELINKIHEVGFSYDGIILNAGAYTHTSIAIADAISAIPCPVIEVHISNTAKRETFRHVWFRVEILRTGVTSFYVSGFAALQVCKLQVTGYRLGKYTKNNYYY